MDDFLSCMRFCCQSQPFPAEKDVKKPCSTFNMLCFSCYHVAAGRRKLICIYKKQTVIFMCPVTCRTRNYSIINGLVFIEAFSVSYSNFFFEKKLGWQQKLHDIVYTRIFHFKFFWKFDRQNSWKLTLQKTQYLKN